MVCLPDNGITQQVMDISLLSAGPAVNAIRISWQVNFLLPPVILYRITQYRLWHHIIDGKCYQYKF